MSNRVGLLLALLFVLGCTFEPAVQSAPPAHQDLWYSLYFHAAHSGYSHVVSSSDTWQGHVVTREDSTTITKLTIFGTVVEQNITSTSYSDSKSGQPYYQSFKIESGGSVTDVTATFTPRTVFATLKSGAETTNKVLQIPAGEKIVDGDTEGMVSDFPLKVGQKETDLEFDPISMSLDKEVSTVVEINIPVKVARDGQIHSTAQVLVTDSEGSATAYQDSSGAPVLILMPANLVMVCTDEAHAEADDSSEASYAVDPASPYARPNRAYNPSLDLAIDTAVSPTGLQLQNERSLVSLTVKVTVADQSPKIYMENAIAVPPPDSGVIGPLASAFPQDAADAPYLSVTDPAIVDTAKKIVGSETEAYQAVKLLHDWVYSHMSPVGTLGLPRSASDILVHPRGVCRDYAILYTSLARASGIPTRINAGLVGFHGAFYYHAWATSYIGGSVGWLPVDATLPTMFVDASHIPLGTGDATVMFKLVGVIGNTKVETLNLRNSL